jgi:hypothetical protein
MGTVSDNRALSIREMKFHSATHKSEYAREQGKLTRNLGTPTDGEDRGQERKMNRSSWSGNGPRAMN